MRKGSSRRYGGTETAANNLSNGRETSLWPAGDLRAGRSCLAVTWGLPTEGLSVSGRLKRSPWHRAPSPAWGPSPCAWLASHLPLGTILGLLGDMRQQREATRLLPQRGDSLLWTLRVGCTRGSPSWLLHTYLNYPWGQVSVTGSERWDNG